LSIPSPPPVSGRGIPSLDGLRAISIGLVLLAHTNVRGKLLSLAATTHLMFLRPLLMIDFGDLGVSLFFVISGFLITNLLLNSARKDGRIGFKRFYLRRFFRIFPPYYFYLGAVGFLWVIGRVPQRTGSFLSALTYTSNYYPYWISQPSAQGWLVGHTWSLSLEEQFYLFWPLCLQFAGKRRAAKLCFALILLSPISRIITIHLQPAFAFDSQITRMFHTRLDSIMMGCLLALLASRQESLLRLKRYAHSHSLALASLVCLTISLCLSVWSTHFFWLGGLTIQALLLAWLLFYSVNNAQTWIGGILNNRVIAHIGVISYSLYLWQEMFLGSTHLFHSKVLSLLMIFLMAEFSYWVVERASYRVRDWIESRQASRLLSCEAL
jgi:peptidoglycan/LPS O-acetylase OafA/YrhL